MLKKITIQNIILTAIILTSLLLLIAIYAYYQNHKKLLHLRDQIRNTEYNLKIEKAGPGIEKIVIPDAREIFRPEILKQHPVNGLQLSVMEYLFSTYSYNLNNIGSGEVEPGLKNLLSVKKKFVSHYAKHKKMLVLVALLALTTGGIWFLYIKCFLSNLKHSSLKSRKELKFGPEGYFHPTIKVGVLQYFEGKIPPKFPKNHYKTLLLNIREINQYKKSHIRGSYKPIWTRKFFH